MGDPSTRNTPANEMDDEEENASGGRQAAHDEDLSDYDEGDDVLRKYTTLCKGPYTVFIRDTYQRKIKPTSCGAYINSKYKSTKEIVRYQDKLRIKLDSMTEANALVADTCLEGLLVYIPASNVQIDGVIN